MRHPLWIASLAFAMTICCLCERSEAIQTAKQKFKPLRQASLRSFRRGETISALSALTLTLSQGEREIV